eukprot:GHRR01016043.1.p2 GENE.GHRR01016043.1~~GHRR01016043.1.p2  ORF type:complete len:144 (+),score=51.52 GHRR01016043.1:380-811(+)
MLAIQSDSGKSLSGKTLAGALLADTNLSNANLQEAVLTKAYAVGANFTGADLTNAVVDRVDFTKASLKGAKFINAVVTGGSRSEQAACPSLRLKSTVSAAAGSNAALKAADRAIFDLIMMLGSALLFSPWWLASVGVQIYYQH